MYVDCDVSIHNMDNEHFATIPRFYCYIYQRLSSFRGNLQPANLYRNCPIYRETCISTVLLGLLQNFSFTEKSNLHAYHTCSSVCISLINIMVKFTILFSQSWQDCFWKFLQDIEVVGNSQFSFHKCHMKFMKNLSH